MTTPEDDTAAPDQTPERETGSSGAPEADGTISGAEGTDAQGRDAVPFADASDPERDEAVDPVAEDGSDLSGAAEDRAPREETAEPELDPAEPVATGADEPSGESQAADENDAADDGQVEVAAAEPDATEEHASPAVAGGTSAELPDDPDHAVSDAADAPALVDAVGDSAFSATGVESSAPGAKTQREGTPPQERPTASSAQRVDADAGQANDDAGVAAAKAEARSGSPDAVEAAEGEAAAASDSAQAQGGEPAKRARRRGPSSQPLPAMLGSGLESRSWLLELPEFEGPLDLLLHLVRRHELDILDIPTSFVTEKYLEYLAFMEALDLEVAGDYLVMAATLAYLKSRELVPTEPSEEDEVAVSDAEGPDPREELIARLLEYQKFRAAAADLDKLPVSGRDVFSRGGEVELPPVDPGLAPLTLFRLAEAYHRVLDRARIHKSHDVVIETCSVAQRMHQLTTILIESSKVDFESLFLGRSWSSEAELRSMLVVTLMSVLELTKLGVIFVRQEVGGDTILLERKSTPEEAKRAIAGYDESISFGAPKPGVAEDPESGEGPDSPSAAGAETPREDAESNSDA